ncbi:MAG: MoaD/ThiS family protein [Firmicutes bacterium]|nr:MoaD/ThiS family protein [Bacillota bacterium]MCL5040605.1 MoaD/ThiS family protein [Bacillota bacterium]
MEVEVLFFNSEGARQKGTYTLAAGARVSDLLSRLAPLPPEAVCLVNGRFGQSGTLLKEGDQVTILPRALGG